MDDQKVIDRQELLSLMETLGLTRAEMCRRLGKSQKQASYWINGKTAVPLYVLAYLRLLARVRSIPGIPLSSIE